MQLLQFVLALPLVLAGPIYGRDKANVIPGKWIVKLKDNADDGLLSGLTSITSVLGKKPDHHYKIGNFQALHVSASEGLIQTIANLGQVEYIEPDIMLSTQGKVTQNNPPYGLARISHRQKGANTYVYDSSAGAGTIAYGIDTGIYIQHNDFGGRAEWGANFVDNNNTDGNGHGTHTAGTVGSSTYGVAKKTHLIAVKVIGASGSGPSSGIMKGIEFAANDMKKRGKKGKAVANLSIGGLRTSNSLNAAARAAVNEGLFMAVAAGNNGAPATLFTPGSEPSVCTVGATDKDDNLASFSNFGPGVDMLAPGVDVESTWIDSPSDTNIISGTSMATPHVAGLAAYYIGLHGKQNGQGLCDKLQKLSTKGAISGLGILLTPNDLAFNGAT